MSHADDRIHGRANFMAHVGQKIPFGLVGLVGGLFRLDEFFFHLLALGDVPQRFDSSSNLPGSII